MRIDRALKRYAKKTALDVTGIAFEPGEICAIMGVNGSGKTTLARSKPTKAGASSTRAKRSATCRRKAMRSTGRLRAMWP